MARTSIKQRTNAERKKALVRVIRHVVEELQDRPMIQPRLLTVKQAATYLGRSQRGIEGLIAEGILNPVRNDRRAFLDVNDLDQWIQEGKN